MNWKQEARMKRIVIALFTLLSASLQNAGAAQTWTEGREYARIYPVQRTTVPAGKVEVMEVFSYGCIACNSFQPTIEKLKGSLPPNAQMVFLPASFIPSEDWVMLQRAYLTARALGIADRTHQAIFDAVWKSGELAISKNPQPSLENAARCYARLTGVTPSEFLKTAHSFSVDYKVKAADDQVAAMQVTGTPCIIVNGKYRVDLQALKGSDELVDLVKYLVKKESGR
jgi:protein dithiol oxidoreductase (disulfide-forming)